MNTSIRNLVPVIISTVAAAEASGSKVKESLAINIHGHFGKLTPINPECVFVGIYVSQTEKGVWGIMRSDGKIANFLGMVIRSPKGNPIVLWNDEFLD